MAFQSNKASTTPNPIPTAMIPALSKCIEIPPTNAPSNTDIIIPIQRQKGLLPVSNSLKINNAKKKPSKYPIMNRVGLRIFFPIKHSVNPMIMRMAANNLLFS